MTLFVARLLLTGELLSEAIIDWTQVVDSLREAQVVHTDNNRNKWLVIDPVSSGDRVAGHLVKVNVERVKVVQGYHVSETQVSEAAKGDALFMLDLAGLKRQDGSVRRVYAVFEECADVSIYQSLHALSTIIEQKVAAFCTGLKAEVYCLREDIAEGNFEISAIIPAVKHVDCHITKANPHPSKLVEDLDSDLGESGADEYIIGAEAQGNRSIKMDGTLVGTAFEASKRYGHWTIGGVSQNGKHYLEISKGDSQIRYLTESVDAAERFLELGIDFLKDTLESGIGEFKEP